MTLRDPSIFEAEGRGAQSEWLSIEEIDNDGRIKITVAEHRDGPSHSIWLTLMQTVELSVWLSRPATAKLVRCATRAAYEGGMPDSEIRSDLLAALDEGPHR